MNISETCFLTLLPGTTKGCHSAVNTFMLSMILSCYQVCLGPKRVVLLLSIVLIFNFRLQGGISLWPEVVYADQWSKYYCRLRIQNEWSIKYTNAKIQKHCQVPLCGHATLAAAAVLFRAAGNFIVKIYEKWNDDLKPILTMSLREFKDLGTLSQVR